MRILNIGQYKIIFCHLSRFWKKAGYSPVYLRQTPVSLTPSELVFGWFLCLSLVFVCIQNDLTGEHSCVMLQELKSSEASDQGQWLASFWTGEAPQPDSREEPFVI